MRRFLRSIAVCFITALLCFSQFWPAAYSFADNSATDSYDADEFKTDDGYASAGESNEADDLAEGKSSDSQLESYDVSANDPSSVSVSTQEATGDETPVINSSSSASSEITITDIDVSAHVQNIGWMKPVDSGETAGTTGRSLNLEALKISLSLSEGATQEQIQNAIAVQSHVSEIGWQDGAAIAKNGQVSGTTGQSRSIEAVRIKLSDDLSSHYSIWYRVHSADFGWLGWAKDGSEAGSAGYGKAVQAIQVVISSKEASAPGDTANAFKNRADAPAALSVRAHVSNIGWLSPVKDGGVAGTTGRSLPLEALNIGLDWYNHSGSVELRGHVSNLGWQSWSEGQCGTTGQSKFLEAVQFRLTGEVAQSYDIWYSVHVSGIGWLDWACNGKAAGTTGMAKSIEAVKVVLVPKGGNAPGSTNKAFIGDTDTVSICAQTISGKQLNSASKRATSIRSAESELLNSLSLNVQGQAEGGSIRYAVQDLSGNWTSENADGSNSSVSAGAPIKAVKIRLDGSLSQEYDVWYRVFDSERGWTGWSSNGNPCGVSNGSSGLSGIEIHLVKKGNAAPGSTDNSYIDTSAVGLVAQAHIADVGWLTPVNDGVTAGQTGKSRSLQALRVAPQGIDAKVEICAHVADIGWQSYVSGDAFAGTVGQGKAIQALKIRLSGNDAGNYDVYYRVHAAGYGWLGWAKNNEIAGTVGLSKQAEAVQVKLVKKGSSVPSQDSPACIQLPSLSVKAHCAGIGWQSPVSNGSVAGTVGQNRALEALQLSLADSQLKGGITYAAHVSDVGWQTNVSDGSTCGTVGQDKSIQAVKISLSGDVSKYFDVWYRVHISNYGWLGWTTNGSAAGTSKLGIPVQAVQVTILPKGAAAPGSTGNSYFETYRYIGYQTPGNYPKVSCSTVKLPAYCTGYFTYVTPSSIPYNATKQDCINAFIQRAREYIGTRYIEPYSSWPGDAVDCSGLVLQCLYATGMDMGWYNPYNHRWLPEQTYNSMNWYRNNTFMPVSTSALQRGDVVYYQGHIAIYIGGGRIIDSWPGIGVTERSVNAPGRLIGAARPFA